jgi:hypothetical protein
MPGSIHPSCDMLIDQNRYIDGDPVGHCCHNAATHVVGTTHFICDECIGLIKSGSDRITIPEAGSVAGWEDRAQAAIKSMMTQMDPIIPAHN